MQLFGRRHDKQLQDQDEKARKQAGEAVRSAMLFLQGRLYGQAAGELRRAVSLDPNSVQAHAYLGMVLQKLGELPEAAEELRASVALAPDDDGLRRTYGTVLESLDQLEDAANEYRSAGRLNPTDSLAPAALGALLLRGDQLEEGEALLRQALAIEPRDPLTLADLAWARQRQGDLEQAIQSLESAISLFADSANPPLLRTGAMPAPAESSGAMAAGFQHRLGLVQESAGNLKAAEHVLRTAHGVLPADAGLLADLARVVIRLSRLNEALALYGKAERDYPELRERFQRDLSRLVAEFGASAAPPATPPADTRAPSPTIGKGTAPTKAEESSDTIARLEQQLRGDPTNRALRRDLSVALLRAGRVAEALEQARLVEQMLSQRGGAEQPAS